MLVANLHLSILLKLKDKIRWFIEYFSVKKRSYMPISEVTVYLHVKNCNLSLEYRFNCNFNLE